MRSATRSAAAPGRQASAARAASAQVHRRIVIRAGTSKEMPPRAENYRPRACGCEALTRKDRELGKVGPLAGKRPPGLPRILGRAEVLQQERVHDAIGER